MSAEVFQRLLKVEVLVIFSSLKKIRPFLFFIFLGKTTTAATKTTAGHCSPSGININFLLTLEPQ
jgi:hypothetical protein